MSVQYPHSAPQRLRRFARSFECRLTVAIVLIIISIGALQILSAQRAMGLRADSQGLRSAIVMGEESDYLLKSVLRFHQLAADLDDDDDRTDARDEATDLAAGIDRQVNAMLINGLARYDTDGERDLFSRIDQVTRAFSGAPDAAAIAAARDRVDAMVAYAASLADHAQARREIAYAQLDRSTRRWHRHVLALGLVIFVFALLILIDVVFVILPALRRMHGSLQRLADGDLEVEIEEQHLTELHRLSDALSTFRDHARAVRALAFADPATGLPNRRAFTQTVAETLAEGPCDADAGERCFVAALDVDRFKYVNDEYGHATGDALVRLIALRMRDFLGSDAVVARIGGDEFAVFARTTVAGGPAALCTDLVAAISEPFQFDGFALAVTISLGFVDVAGGGDDVAHLLHRADLALYAAKRGGRNQAAGFEPALEEEGLLDRTLERDLATAMAAGQMRVVYQPIHEGDGGWAEVEALVRWTHPTLGAISPARFIPAAERSGCMPRLGNWILERALCDLARWPDMAMSLNLSSLQLQQDGFVGFLLAVCRRHDIAPQRLYLEVTETISIEGNTRALLTLGLLREAGFRIALDDFGTGYSSLSMMKTFHFDRLKLDRSLVEDVSSDAASQAVFQAAVQMARQIGAEVVAEGISGAAMVGPALKAGCTHLQGFHLGYPLEADVIDQAVAAEMDTYGTRPRLSATG